MTCKRMLILLIAGFFISTLSMPSFAIMSVPFGWYAELNGGVMRISDEGFPGNVKSLNGLGANLSLGYKFMPFLSAELGYTAYSTTTIQDQFGDTAGEVSHHALDLVAKGILPITDSGFEAFTKVGVVFLTAKYSVTNAEAANNIGATSSKTDYSTRFYMALGGQYYFMPELAMNLQWARANGNSSTGTLDLYSVGVSFIFD